MSAEARAEYDRDRRFVLAFAAFFDARPQSPTTVVGTGQPDGSVTYREIPTTLLALASGLAAGLEEGEARRGGVDRVGLNLVLQALLEMSRDLAAPELAEADCARAADGLPTLSAMQRRVWRTIPKVLERGRIRTETEYYLLVERLNDVSGDDGLTDTQQGELATIVNEYEDRRARGRSRS